MSQTSSDEGGPSSTLDASDEEDDSRVRNKTRSGKRNIRSSSASSSPRGTPDSLRSGQVQAILPHNVFKKGDFHFSGSDSSDSESSCGYPLLTALSRSPSIRSIPDVPFHPMFYMNRKPSKKRRFFQSKVRPSSARSSSSRPLYSSRSSTAAGDRQQGQTEEDGFDLALESYWATKRPVSAPNFLRTRRKSCMRSRRSTPKVSFAPLKSDNFHSNVQTQTYEVQNSKLRTVDRSSSLVTHSATQTLPSLSEYSTVTYDDVFPQKSFYRESKSIQTEATFPRGREHTFGKYMDVTISAIAKREKYNKLRTSSARGPRRQKSSEKLSVQRCKSALAIMVTRKQGGDTSCSVPRQKDLTDDFDSDQSDSFGASSNLSDVTYNFYGKGTRKKASQRHYHTHTSTHMRKTNQQSVKITPSKLAKLKKAYGKTNFDLSGLSFYTKKLRLPMHGGYKSVTSREVDGIVERLSACRLSCGRMHDYSSYDTTVPSPRRKRRECHTAPSTRGSSRPNPGGSKEQAGRCNKQKISSKNKRAKGERLNQEFGTVLTKSLNQIEDSLSRARYVLSNLSGYVSTSPPECRRHRTSSLRRMSHGALVGRMCNSSGLTGEMDETSKNLLIEKKIREAWTTNPAQFISPEWMHITKTSCFTDIYPDLSRPPFLTTKQKTLPYLKRSEALMLSTENEPYKEIRAKSCHDAHSGTKFPSLKVDVRSSTTQNFNV